ncbi:NAD(P)/FAD-dependent oxidoreductase [Marixanthomonas spongiae]|uniref:FAD-dependent oxidoreductase n=1 Tax=Marixanthomonas spongiae TaxID=2174845 RepID=A0A2U0I2B5_9FLAO|nr:FAD-dependent oxidoreductase [Marixanthomonas spongiae]PVW15204.1 FAD-dependent oxidoreductase [Marixanthomonas spongiae]
MTLSYWEHKMWLQNIDYAIVGSGLVGLNCALALKEKHPTANITVFEKGMLPSGASTKNAGFACFGSLSEILDDLSTHSEEEVINLVKERVQGLQLLRKNIGDKQLDLKHCGGYELFTEEDGELFKQCKLQLHTINRLLIPIFNDDVFSITENAFQFKKIQPQLVFNKFEGQIDTGKMMHALLQKVYKAGITVLNCAEVTSLSQDNESVSFQLNNSINVSAKKVCIANNGFAKQLLDEAVQPARAQVLITNPIENLHIKGTFHLDKGYYYFRNINDRILFGGGRNLNFKGEETTEMITTNQIQNKLEELLNTTILPKTTFEIDRRWSGIMGVGKQKKPIVKEISPNIFCAVRLGGMGVAIGTAMGYNLAKLASR